jgi:glycosyltransferase involved in cell wall biosynthesis
MSSNLVSVIIPVYNGKRFIEECLLSVLNQSHSALEIIVINDGSTDNTLNLLQKIKASDERVRIITIKNSGRAAARNKGIKAAKGYWTAFLDADDAWTCNKLDKQLKAANENNADFIYTERTWVDDSSCIKAQPQKYDLPSGLIFESLVEGNYICTSTVLVKTSVLKLENGFDESATFKNVQDYDLWLRLSHKYIFQSLPDELCLYRLHDNNAHKNVRNRFIGLRGCIETMKLGLINYSNERVDILNKKIDKREHEISKSFVRALFHAKANSECLSALKTVSSYCPLTIKERIFKALCNIRLRIND